MTELRPCQACARHVAVHEVVCPFCAVALVPAVPQRIVLRGRVTRAAVFGAALVAGACSKTHEPAKQAPAHVGSGSDDDMKELERVLDDPTMLAGSAAAPVDAAADALAIAVTPDAALPDAGVDPEVARREAERKRKAAEHRRLEAERQREQERQRLEQQQLDLQQQQLDRQHVAKPYGAPPARRRLV